MNALMVVAKQPVPGQTKTRLAPPLSLEQAAALYEGFLRDTLDLMRAVPDARRVIAYLPREARDLLCAARARLRSASRKAARIWERGSITP